MTEPVISVEINTKNLDLAMRLFPRRLKINLGDAFDHISRHFLKDWRGKQLQGPPGLRSSSQGIFKQFKRVSLVPVGGDINNMGFEIFATSKIARQHERGETVTAQGGGKLAVPLSARAELFSGSGMLKRKYRKPGALKGLVRIRFGEKTFLTKIKKRTREVLPLFVLKPSVKLQPRLGFLKTWDSQANWRLERLNKAIEKTLNEV